MCGWVWCEEAEDRDGDGLDDALEQRLLERFAPRLQTSSKDCDGKPAFFEAGVPHPEPLERDGTLYGQAFLKPSEGARLIEIHYYHLWSRDCGRNGHPLDAEHVSVLVQERAGEWRALYWYAAAHERTLCDTSTAARAAVLGAEDRGAAVWVSRDKHASFFDVASCGGGCGGDSCKGPYVPHEAKRVVNLGEPGRPMNGATWIGSTQWDLAGKMGSDFPDVLVAELEGAEGNTLVRMKPHLRPAQAALSGGGRAMVETKDAVGFGGSTAWNETAQATDKATATTGRAVGTAGKKTKGAIGRAWGAVKGK
jgi:hypothetical protein